MRIIPAVLTDNEKELIDQLSNIVEYTDEVDIDVMDGIFVASKSCDLNAIPKDSKLAFNFDLMVQEPLKYITQIKQIHQYLAVNRVFIHIESSFDINELFAVAQDQFTLGFSLTVPTAIENFIDIYKKVKTISDKLSPPLLLKTVDIGRQGNPYHPEVLYKILALRKSGINTDIYIDGGVNPDVIQELKSYSICGVSVGSYLSKSSDPFRAYHELKDALWQNSKD